MGLVRGSRATESSESPGLNRNAELRRSDNASPDSLDNVDPQSFFELLATLELPETFGDAGYVEPPQSNSCSNGVAMTQEAPLLETPCPTPESPQTAGLLFDSVAPERYQASALGVESMSVFDHRLVQYNEAPQPFGNAGYAEPSLSVADDNRVDTQQARVLPEIASPPQKLPKTAVLHDNAVSSEELYTGHGFDEAIELPKTDVPLDSTPYTQSRGYGLEPRAEPSDAGPSRSPGLSTNGRPQSGTSDVVSPAVQPRGIVSNVSSNEVRMSEDIPASVFRNTATARRTPRRRSFRRPRKKTSRLRKPGTEKPRPAPVVAPSPQCEICGAKTPCDFHGVQCCGNCTAFFISAWQRAVFESKRELCSAANDCSITERNRNSCPACRLKKCLEKGLRKPSEFPRSLLSSHLGNLRRRFTGDFHRPHLDVRCILRGP